jgi:chemotaxis family two-component system response regulator Rcp1
MEPLAENKMTNVLLVEDDPANRKLVQEAFKAAEFKGALSTVNNSDELMRFLDQKYASMKKLPDLILLDLNLPGKSGIEIIPEIQNDERFKRIPIVCLTSSNAASDIKACSEYRCKYLIKPTRFHELVGLVKSLPGLYIN